ncbi:MAG TPA: hypothetical protein VGG03_01375 [Thermoanaerobaculia bacterium]|jgi:hypothetical protein
MTQHSTSKGRILGRRVARVMTREQVASATGSAQVGPPTYTLTDPPDRDRLDGDL